MVYIKLKWDDLYPNNQYYDFTLGKRVRLTFGKNIDDVLKREEEVVKDVGRRILDALKDITKQDYILELTDFAITYHPQALKYFIHLRGNVRKKTERGIIDVFKLSFSGDLNEAGKGVVIGLDSLLKLRVLNCDIDLSPRKVSWFPEEYLTEYGEEVFANTLYNWRTTFELELIAVEVRFFQTTPVGAIIIHTDEGMFLRKFNAELLSEYDIKELGIDMEKVPEYSSDTIPIPYIILYEDVNTDISKEEYEEMFKIDREDLPEIRRYYNDYTGLLKIYELVEE